jgi:hypothetical protein
MITHATSGLLRDRLLLTIGRIQGADWNRQLDALNAQVIQAHGAGALLDDHADAVFQAVQDRRDRMVVSAALHRSKERAGGARGGVTPLGAFAFDRLAALSPIEPATDPSGASRAAAAEQTAAPRKFRPRVTHDERAERQAATRRRYYTGHRLPWPATIKQDFHPAELSAIGVIFREIRERDACELALGTIAARAKCCRRTVQTAIRWAAHRGYLAIEERVKGTHVIRIASAAIREWVSRIRSPEAKKTKDKEDLNVPDKVATGYRSSHPSTPGGRAGATSQPSEVGSAPESGAHGGEGVDPPTRLDDRIASWRRSIVPRRVEASAKDDPTRFGPFPVLRPG